ncbi:hypothetical protein CDAR_260881 [Caerostris darwini]|uniref:Uncharacterized protein n=1 Tax=Caerostris darwini TaxID=1538125 RepID=A0AAV4MFT2_9ARAC|nr:hypothetical protein CDAR_260881 [Caerostris darwini]
MQRIVFDLKKRKEKEQRVLCFEVCARRRGEGHNLFVTKRNSSGFWVCAQNLNHWEERSILKSGGSRAAVSHTREGNVSKNETPLHLPRPLMMTAPLPHYFGVFLKISGVRSADYGRIIGTNPSSLGRNA